MNHTTATNRITTPPARGQKPMAENSHPSPGSPARGGQTLAMAALTGALLTLSHASAAISMQTVALPPQNIYTGSTSSLNQAAPFAATFTKFDITTGVLTNVSFTYNFTDSATFSGTSGGERRDHWPAGDQWECRGRRRHGILSSSVRQHRCRWNGLGDWDHGHVCTG